MYHVYFSHLYKRRQECCDFVSISGETRLQRSHYQSAICACPLERRKIFFLHLFLVSLMNVMFSVSPQTLQLGSMLT